MSSQDCKTSLMNPELASPSISSKKRIVCSGLISYSWKNLNVKAATAFAFDKSMLWASF